VAERFVNDVRDLVAIIKANPEEYVTGGVAMYGKFKE